MDARKRTGNARAVNRKNATKSTAYRTKKKYKLIWLHSRALHTGTAIMTGIATCLANTDISAIITRNMIRFHSCALGSPALICPLAVFWFAKESLVLHNAVVLRRDF